MNRVFVRSALFAMSACGFLSAGPLLAAGAPASEMTAKNERALPPPPKPAEFHPAHVLVRTKPDAAAPMIDALDAKAGVKQAIYTSTLVPGLRCVEVPAGTVQQAIAIYTADPQVLYAEADPIVYATSQEAPYGVVRVQAPAVWTTTQGGGVIVADLDTGIDLTHPDLPAPAESASFIPGETVQDGHGHGTHTAGTICALNNDIGVVGVAPQITLIVGKVLANSGSGPISQIIAGIDWAVSRHARVINMSLGGPSFSQSQKDSCDAAVAANVVVVAAAGNDNSSAPHYPASYASVIAVAAVDSDNLRASFSNFGPYVALSAPGVSVLSTVPGGYQYFNGTSMAAPHVSGVAALLISKFHGGITAAQVREQLQATATDLGTPGRDDQFGYGLVNAAAALQWTPPPWQQYIPSGEAPVARYVQAMAYDSYRHRTVMFGGITSGHGSRLNDLWEWDGQTWQQRTASGPSPRSSCTMAYDPVRRRTVLFGGSDDQGFSLDTWEWDGTAWFGPFFGGGAGRANTAMTFSDDLQGILMFGGQTGGSTFANDTWKWDGAAWRLLQSGPMAPRSSHAMAYDSSTHSLMIFGGSNVVNNTLNFFNDTIVGEFGRLWTHGAALNGPSPRYSHAMVYDRARQVTVLFGGATSAGPNSSETWEYFGNYPGTWTRREIAGPSARYGHTMAYDSDRQRVVLFGGYTDTGTSNETWELGVPCSTPVITTQPGNLQTCDSTSNPLILTIQSPGNGQVFLWQWQPAIGAAWLDIHDGVNIDPAAGPIRFTAQAISDFQCSLTAVQHAGIPAAQFNYRCMVTNGCGSTASNPANITVSACACNLADIVGIGGTPPPDGLLTGDDFNAFISAFAGGDPLADIVGIGGQPPSDGLITGDDFNAFIGAFAAGCP